MSETIHERPLALMSVLSRALKHTFRLTIVLYLLSHGQTFFLVCGLLQACLAAILDVAIYRRGSQMLQSPKAPDLQWLDSTTSLLLLSILPPREEDESEGEDHGNDTL